MKDIGKDSLLKHISEFAREDTAYLYALVIMAHGDLNGNVSDVNSEPISVQSVIDAFCHGTLTPKVRHGCLMVYNGKIYSYKLMFCG